MTSAAGLRRRLGLGDAVFIGLGAMLGAGVFVVWAPAAEAAGAGLLIGLSIAAVVATCNALSSAQLAAQYPTSGGAYAFGRERLGEWWGFTAGWCFLTGKTASCAAMALTFAAYAAPDSWSKPVAIGAVVLLTAVNYVGVGKTAAVTRVLVIIVLAVLGLVVVAAGVGGAFPLRPGGDAVGTPYGVLQSAGLLFFAFAGYARVATLGEEVRDPARTIPRAVAVSLTITAIVYATLAVITLSALGTDALATSTAPLADVVTVAGWPWAAPVVAVGAAVGSLGALLALIAGVGRTSLAMARAGDLPRPLSAVHPRFAVPHRAEVAAATAVCVLIAVADARDAIAFSSFGVLLYYAVANLAALTQHPPHRRYPRAVAVAGLLGCLILVVTLPLSGIVGGGAVLVIGLLGRLFVIRRRTAAPR